MTRRVDVHVHHLPRALVEAYGRRDRLPRLSGGPEERMVEMGGGIAYPLFRELVEPELRLRSMDELVIAASLLSVPPPALEGFAAAEAVALASACNDELAALGPRLPALALLPLQAPEQAAEELRRAVGLGLRGGTLFTNVDGARPDHERFAPVLDTADELRVPLVLHPATPAGVDAASGYALPTTLGFLIETAVSVLRLVLGGLFDRHPSLTLVVPHLGATIPFLLGRIDYEAELLPGGSGALDRPPSEHLRLLHVDSVCSWPPALRLALEVLGTGRVLLGTDAPYWGVREGVETVEAAALDTAEAAAVRHANADRLFRLGALT